MRAFLIATALALTLMGCAGASSGGDDVDITGAPIRHPAIEWVSIPPHTPAPGVVPAPSVSQVDPDQYQRNMANLGIAAQLMRGPAYSAPMYVPAPNMMDRDVTCSRWGNTLTCH